MISKIRAVLFIFVIYSFMALLGIIAAPYAMISRDKTYNMLKFYCRGVVFFARWIIGITVEIRGEPPKGHEIIVSKHQSFLDILVIFNAVPRPKFIMKREILYTPFIGFYAKRVGSAPVKRGAKGAAIKQMLASIEDDKGDPGQLVIFPQGTRVPPGDYKPYKIGAGALYTGLNKVCIPVATNVGVFWPKKFLNIRAGHAVVEFLPAVPAGKPIAEFMAEIEKTVESHSNRLMAEGGYRKQN